LRNVLALYLRKRILTLEDAQGLMAQAQELMQGREYEVPSAAVVNLAASSPCPAYDCEFVALAQDLHVPLVTVDRQVLSNFVGVAITREEYLR
jgi:predicted nucleic acid-binding protein